MSDISLVLSAKGVKCHHQIKDIKYITDVDITGSKVLISVRATIESFLLQEEAIRLIPTEALEEKSAVLKSEKSEHNSCTPHNVKYEGEDSLKKDLERLESISARLLNTFSSLSGENKRYKEKQTTLEKQISSLEHEKRMLERDRSKLYSDVSAKDALICELNKQIEQYKRNISDRADEIKMLDRKKEDLEKENSQLKAFIEEKNREKRQNMIDKIKDMMKMKNHNH